MKIKTGVWLDSKQAYLITITNDEKDVQEIESGIETREREDGESKSYGRFGKQYIDPEKHHEHKVEHQSKHFVREIIDLIKERPSFVVFGPAHMKHELEKEIHKQHLSERLLDVVTSDIMTQNQMAAWVKDFYKSV